MSAIAAIIYLDGRPVEPNVLRRVSDSLAHRGSDRHGELASGNAGLVHRMRFTTPESLTEELPRRSGTHLVTCDARIDNREDLGAKLSLTASAVSDLNDSDLILAAYDKWGDDCAAHIVGDFVFAIWDDRERKLFAARDPLGIKHFYYYYAPNKLFALASEIAALFELPEIDRQLDETSLGDFLVLNAEDKERTFFKGITRLPSSHALRLDQGSLKTWEYWRPSSDEIKLKNSRQYQEAFREKLETAVTSRLRSAYPVGSFLSGGLDSSAIVCLASNELKRQKREPLETYSAIFPSVAEVDPRIDELSYIRSVVDATGCNANFIEADQGNPLSFMQRIFRHAEHPAGAPNAYMDCQIYAAAERKGTRVLLSGIDGDSTVGYGYEDFTRMAQRGMLIRLFRDSMSLRKNMPGRRHTFKRTFWNRGLKQAVPASFVDLWRTLLQRQADDAKPSAVRFPKHLAAVRPRVREELGIEDRAAQLLTRNFPPEESPAELHWRGLTSGHFSLTLEQLEKISAAYGIEVRYPFFDRRLVEFCIALPPGERTYKGWTRSIMRHGLQDVMPRDVCWRTDKSNIGASVKVNLIKYGYDQLNEAINVNTAPLEPYLDVPAVQRSLREYARSPLEREADALLVLSSVYLSNWLRFTGFG